MPSISIPTAFPSPSPKADACSFWFEQLPHQGVAAFNPDASYKVFRSVKDFGAKGDGVSDDTQAIQNAISSGNRVSPATNLGSTTTQALVYFPPGEYLISKPIVDYFFTQLIGNPNCMPVIKAAPGFEGGFMFDGDPYNNQGQLGETSTNLFYRQIRNFVMDVTAGPPGLTAVHWPTGQATSLQNMVFKLSGAANSQQTGVLIESGSGGFVGDLVFTGGQTGMTLANQQFTMRNLSFTNTATAINQAFDWGWTFQQLHVRNAKVAINMTSGGSGAQSVAAVNLIDSLIEDTPIGIVTAHSATSLPPGSGSLNVENVQLKNVPTAIKGADQASSLAGTSGTTTIVAWSDGRRYTGASGSSGAGPISPNPRSGQLLDASGQFYTKAKPEYANEPVSNFVTARSQGAVGNGVADDTAALQKAIDAAAASHKILYVDAGTYKVTSTIDVPPGSRIFGEAYAVIMSSGPAFADMKKPTPVVRVGKVPGIVGTVEMTDLIVSTQSDATKKTGQAGAVLIEWNLFSPPGAYSGMWDVHTRISGFTGSNQGIADCPTTPNTQTSSASQVNPQCITAFMSIHITPSASGLLLENNWFWTSDHDIDTTAAQNQITVYTGRGMLVDTALGGIWLYGTAVEHHALYQYQFANARGIVMGQIQTETPYWQPNPNATIPFPAVAALSDPVFPQTAYTTNGTLQVPNADAWGARFLRSTEIFVYGVGLYSFFDNYSTACNAHAMCQSRIMEVSESIVYVYDLHTVGTINMITLDGKDIAPFNENSAGFTSNVAAFRDFGGY